MDKSDASLERFPLLYPPGQVVVSRRGKDRGRYYVVVGLERERLILADADKFNLSRPKRKNPRHIQLTSCRAMELLGWIEAGKNIDRGYFCQILARLGNAPREK